MKIKESFIKSIVRPWQVILFCGIIMCIAPVLWIISRIHSPSIGQVQGSKSGTQARPIAIGKKVYVGKYFSFSYRANYRTIPLKAEGNRIEVIDLLGIRPMSKELTAAVTSVPLAEDSNIRFRQLNKQTYSEAPVTVAKKTGLVFSKRQNAYEKSVFIAYDNMVVSIALTDPSGQNHDQEFQQILDSVRWH